jgi:hypothetical protein
MAKSQVDATDLLGAELDKMDDSDTTSDEKQFVN